MNREERIQQDLIMGKLMDQYLEERAETKTKKLLGIQIEEDLDFYNLLNRIADKFYDYKSPC